MQKSPHAPSAKRRSPLRPVRDAMRSFSVSLHRLRPTRSVRALLSRATYIHVLLLPALLLLLFELSPTPPTSFPSTSITSGRRPSSSAPLFPSASTIRPGVSLVAVCMNRHSTLPVVLPAWRDVANVSEILLLDWSSQPPLEPLARRLLSNDPRLRVVRVDHEPVWVLTRAYNLAIALSTRQHVLRTDCDYTIAKDFVVKHPLPPTQQHQQHPPTFYAGNYAHARDENEVHLNGAVFIRRTDFFAVGGYDERIQTYGWDDEDLYHRLEKHGLQKLALSYNHVKHVPHDDHARAQRDVKFVQVEIDLNSLLLQQLGQWNRSHFDHANRLVPSGPWTVRETRGWHYTRLSASRRPSAIKDLVTPHQYHNAWHLALGQRLANDFHVPWDIMVTMSVELRRRLLTRLMARMEHRPADKPARIVFVHCMHGLGNRLRALGSAMAFAKTTDREIVVVWEKDAHIAALFQDLFADDLVVLSDFRPKWPFDGYDQYDKLWRKVDWYNYMEMEGHGAVKGQKIVEHAGQHVYFKSAYVMEASNELTDWNKDNAMLRSLTPVAEVMQMVQRHERTGLDRMVGVHIRDRTLERDIENVNFGKEYGDAASKEMEFWRKKSAYSNFVVEMKRLVEKDGGTRFYVASDTVEVMQRLEKQLPGRIAFTRRDCDGRDGRCVRFALVDILCLAKCRELMGSNWSSFTEAANRFGGMAPRLAGKDFAKGSEEVGDGADGKVMKNSESSETEKKKKVMGNQTVKAVAAPM